MNGLNQLAFGLNYVYVARFIMSIFNLIFEIFNSLEKSVFLLFSI